MEIVLGIDNILLVAILSAKVDAARRKQVRRLGIGLALVMRIGLLFGAVVADGADQAAVLAAVRRRPAVGARSGAAGRRAVPHLQGDLRAVRSHRAVAARGPAAARRDKAKPAGFTSTLVQILALDLVFSLDSVITAVGMARAISVMMAAMVIAVTVMLIFANVVADFVTRHPSMKVLALAFLLLIGVLLTADAFGQHINRGYVYFAMAFSLVVELLNLRLRKKSARTRAI